MEDAQSKTKTKIEHHDHRRTPHRLRKTSLSRGFSDGSTMSVEEFRPRRIQGLFLTFSDLDLETQYQEFQLESSRWWMYAVFLFQSICELILTVMNVFTYFELSGEFQKDVVPQDSKVRDSFPSETQHFLPTKHSIQVHSIISIVFHIVAFVIFLLFSLLLSGTLKRCGMVHVTRENWWRVRKPAIFLWFFVYSSLHMFLDFQIPLEMETAVAVGIMSCYHTFQIMCLSCLPILWSVSCAVLYSVVLYGSVVCSSGVCAIVGLDGDFYGQYDHPHFGEWGFFAILSCHLTMVVAIAFCKFRLEWKDREFFVNKKWIQERWHIDKVKQNPLGAINIGRFVDSSNNFDMDELMWESLSPSEKAVVKMQTPMLEWNWWCLHFFCCKNMRNVTQKNDDLERMENGLEEFEDSKPRRKSRLCSCRQTIRNRSFKRQKTYDPLGQWYVDLFESALQLTHSFFF